MLNIGIIGGGPGGLITAYQLQTRLKVPFHVTLYEASGRTGGKVTTKEFAKAPGYPYEGGVAELYAVPKPYPDYLRSMIEVDLGLKTRPLWGSATVMDIDGKESVIIRNEDSLAELFGTEQQDAVAALHNRLLAAIAPRRYHGKWNADPDNPLAQETWESLTADLPEEARRWLFSWTKSDVAVEPHRTNGVYGAQNYLLNFPQYLSLYTPEGGISTVFTALTDKIAKLGNVDILYNRRVCRVAPSGNGYAVEFDTGEGHEVNDHDIVITCIPAGWLQTIEWDGSLRSALRNFFMKYDNLAHYLRVTVLYKEPFWRDWINQGQERINSWWMTDRLGGHCVYDEGSRLDDCPFGILSHLLNGDSALVMSNLPDDRLVEMCVDSLPAQLRDKARAEGMLLEWDVNRFVGEVSGLPGGSLNRNVGAVNPDDDRPDPDGNPNFLVVGDYLEDATINGVFLSAMQTLRILMGQPKTSS